MMDVSKKFIKTGYPSIDKPWLKYYNSIADYLEYPNLTLYQYVWNNNKDYMDETALVYFDKRISYRMFFNEIEKAAKAFTAYGVKTGDIVTIMSMHTPETIYAFYGLNFIGAIGNLVYMTLSEKEILETIKNTDSKMVFVLESITEKIMEIKEQLRIPIVMLPIDESMPLPIKWVYRIKAKSKNSNFEKLLSFKDFLKQGDSWEKIKCTADPFAEAVIVYTSGTTGEPKGVCHTNYNLNAFVTQECQGIVEFKRKKECLLILPPFIGFGISMMHLLVSTGIKVILQISLEPKEIHKNLFKYKPYVFLTGPALIEDLLSHKPGDLRPLTYLWSGGGSITDDQIQRMDSFLNQCGAIAKLSNGYGMTENCATLAMNVNDVNKIGSVGIPLIATVVKVVDVDTNESLKYGEVGELWFSTPNLMQRYYKNSEATSDTIVIDNDGQRWLRTGDLGYVDEDGFIFLKGRLKRIYITMGKDNMAYKLFPQRIEEVFSDLEEVKKCAIVVQKDKDRMNIPVAFIELVDMRFDEMQIEQLKDQLLHRVTNELPEHMIPSEIHLIHKMPLTASGKIDYRELEKMN